MATGRGEGEGDAASGHWALRFPTSGQGMLVTVLGPGCQATSSSTHLNASSSAGSGSEFLVAEKFSLVKWVWFHISCPWLTYLKVTSQMLPARDKVPVV